MGAGALAGRRQHQYPSSGRRKRASGQSELTSQPDIAGTNVADFCQQANPGDSNTDAILQQSLNQLSADIFGFPFSLSIAIPSVADTPLVGISEGFTKLTGYSREEIVGRNCRFMLEGVPQEDVNMETRHAARRYCRMAHLRNLTSMAHTVLVQRNRRKNGELFWNFFMLAVVPSSDRTFIVGLQLDLGAELVNSKGAHSADDMAATLNEHRKRLLLVQAAMFGPSIPKGLPEPEESLSDVRQFPGSGDALPVCKDSSEDSRVSNTISRHINLAEEVKLWLTHAESSCSSYQLVGTLPWVAWPTSRHALLNGGATVLRLEADTVPKGAVAMSVFPASVGGRARSFRLRVDAVCAHFKQEGVEVKWLPSMGFTEMSPAVMDDLGGLPNDIEDIPESITLRGDGQLCQFRDGKKCSATGVKLMRPQASSYQVCAGDALECTWFPGCMNIRANGEVILEVQHQMIHDPLEHAVYGVVDCCYAACKVTLLS